MQRSSIHIPSSLSAFAVGREGAALLMMMIAYFDFLFHPNRKKGKTVDRNGNGKKELNFLIKIMT